MTTPRDTIDARETRIHESFILDAWQTRREYVTEYRARLQKLDAFLMGDWSVEFPDGRVVRDKPKIEDRVMTKIEDTGYLAGSVMPTIRVEPLDKRDYLNAERRERVLQYYWQNSEVSLILPRLYMDLIGTGMCAMLVWPDFRKPKNERFPTFKRLDPRHILPPLDYAIEGGVEPNDVITHRVVKTRNLEYAYPEQIGKLRALASQVSTNVRGRPRNKIVDVSQVLVIEYFGRDRIIRVAMVDGFAETIVTLENVENPTECCSVVLGIRPTADGRIRGKVEAMMPILAAENRLMTYVLDYADQMVFAPLKVKGDVVNPGDFGPNAIIDVGTSGDVDRIPPAPGNPALFKIISDLAQHSRRVGNHPAARAGEIDQSIGSAAFVESLMSGLTTEVQTLQKIVEVMLRQSNVIAQEQDKIFCDERKTIAGLAKGGSFRETYVPSDLLKDTANFVSYGAGSGLDKFNAETRMTMREQHGYVSKRWVRENMDGIENVTQEENRLMDEAALQALMQFVLTAAAQGDPEPLKAFMGTRRRNVDPLTIVDELAPVAVGAGGAGAPPGPAPMPRSPEQQARAMQKGGTVGNAAMLKGLPGQGAAMAIPPLAGVLG